MQYIVVNITPDKAQVQDVRDKLYFVSRNDKPDHYWLSEQHAEREAQDLARRFPQQQFAVMVVKRVFETTTPKVIAKTYNEQGELILENKDK